MDEHEGATRVQEAARHSLDESARRRQALTVVAWFGAMVIGAVLGNLHIAQLDELFTFIATVFTRLFQFVAVPVIALAVITTLATLGARRETGRIFGHAILYTLSTTFAAALVALSLFILIAPENVPATGGSTIPDKLGRLSYYEHLLSVIPNNILQPFVSGNVLSVLLIASAAGLALAFMPRTENRETLVRVIAGLQELLFFLIRALLTILPVGILAFTAQLVAEIRAGVIVGALGQYVAVVIGSNLLQFFVIIPLFLLARHLNPITVFRGMSPALAVAFFSKSSAGTLPVTMASAEDNLHLDRRVTRFVLPICTTIHITAGTMCVWLFVAVLAAIGNAGVPMGCYFLTLSLMSSMNVPVDLMGVILPIYAIIDMIETGVNVWSDSSVAAMTDHDLRGKLPLAAMPGME